MHARLGRSRGPRWVSVLVLSLALSGGVWAVADELTFNLTRPNSQLSPQAGAHVTYGVVAINSTSEEISRDISVVWKRPDGDAVAAFQYEVTLQPGARQSFSQPVTLAGGGRYRIIVHDPLDEPTQQNALTSWTFDVTKVNLSSSSEIEAAVTAEVTHTPEQPRAEPMRRGMPDHRDLITVTVVLTNTHAYKTCPGGPICTRTCNTALTGSAAQVGSADYTLPELAPGESHTGTLRFKLDEPGAYSVEIRKGGYPGPVLDMHPIQAVPWTINSLTAPTVSPAQGPPGTQFTLGVTFISAQDTAPSAVKVALSPLTGQQFTMQKVTPSDTSYLDGCAYTYTTPGNLPAGNHSMCFTAFQGTQELATTGYIPGPSITDNVPPTIEGGGQQRPDVIVQRAGDVTLNGTASDAEIAVDKVEWRETGGAWHNAVGQENWTFTCSADVSDQQTVSKTFEVRAYDLAGNVTPVSGYWKQKVIWERRHPRILEYRVTDAVASPPTGCRPSKWTSPPQDNGSPLIGEYYVIAFKVRNDNPTETYTFDFCWKEDELQYEPQHPPWPLNMDSPGYCPAGPVIIQPLETAWIYTYWKHDWSWIKEKGAYDFLLDATTAWIPIAGEIGWGLGALDMLCTAGFGVKETTWYSKRGEGMPQSVMSPTLRAKAVVKVPIEKKLLFLESMAASATGTVATGVGMALGWNPAGWALLATEAAMIVTSHVAYHAAYDPNPDFEKRVKVEPVEVPELDRIEDDDERRYAEAAIHVAENATALKEAYVRYVAARDAGNEKMAGMHLQDAATFAQEAAVQSAVVERQMSAAARSARELTEEDRGRVLRELADQGLPEYEREILINSFGFSAKDVAALGEMQQKILPMAFDDPTLGTKAARSMTQTFRSLATEFKKGASKYPN